MTKRGPDNKGQRKPQSHKFEPQKTTVKPFWKLKRSIWVRLGEYGSLYSAQSIVVTSFLSATGNVRDNRGILAPAATMPRRAATRDRPTERLSEERPTQMAANPTLRAGIDAWQEPQDCVRKDSLTPRAVAARLQFARDTLMVKQPQTTELKDTWSRWNFKISTGSQICP